MRVFGFIEAEKAKVSIKFMCEQLGVTRQGFCVWRRRPPCRRRITDAAYTAVITKIHAGSRGNYGAPQIRAELADDYGIRCGRKLVALLMRLTGIIGWSYATHMRTELIVDAIDMAIESRRPLRSLIHHSDQGSQYSSIAFGRRCRRAGIVLSMGSRGDCFDNSMAA